MYLYIKCLLLVFVLSISAKDLKISLIIPCHIKHVQHLQELLKIYTHQTLLPHEIIISISEVSNGINFIKDIQAADWPFEVKILTTNNMQRPGQNRNTACNNATGDIFICQDADDLPHPQRVEIISYFFEKYNIDHFMHAYFILKQGEEADFPIYHDITQLACINPIHYQTIWKFSRPTNGNVSISKQLFNQMKWSSAERGQDVKFNKAVYLKFKKRLVINNALIAYRQFLSSNAVS